MYIQEVDQHMKLRMLTIRDAEPLFQLIESSRTYLKEWLSWLSKTRNLTDVRPTIKESFQTYANQRDLRAGIFIDNILVGVLSYNEFDWQNKIGYIGYWLGKDFQVKAIMTQAVAICIDYRVKESNLNKIDIRTAFENIKSQMIPKRVNLKQEGHLRQAEWLYHHYVDHLVFGMLKEDWNSDY